MIIFGIDPGYARIGYGVIEKTHSGLKALAVGTVETPPTESIPVRLAMLDEQMTAILRVHKPDAVAVEELFFNTNVTTGIKVAQARGVILVCAIKECGKLYEYTPLQVKMALTGNGRAEKQQVQYMVKAMLALKEIPKPDDAADALAVAICHANTSEYKHRTLN